jgi:hypothetical protein
VNPTSDAGDDVGDDAAASGATPSLPPPSGGRTDPKPKPAPDAGAADPSCPVAPELPRGARTEPNTDAGATTLPDSSLASPASPITGGASASAFCPPLPPPSGGRTDPNPNADLAPDPIDATSVDRASPAPPALPSGGFNEPKTGLTEPKTDAPAAPAAAPPELPSGARTDPNTDAAPGASAPVRGVGPYVSFASPGAGGVSAPPPGLRAPDGSTPTCSLLPSGGRTDPNTGAAPCSMPCNGKITTETPKDAFSTYLLHNNPEKKCRNWRSRK